MQITIKFEDIIRVDSLKSMTPKRRHRESFFRRDLNRRLCRKRRRSCPYESFFGLDWNIGHWVPKSISDPYTLHGNCIIDNPSKEILTFARMMRHILVKNNTLANRYVILHNIANKLNRIVSIILPIVFCY